MTLIPSLRGGLSWAGSLISAIGARVFSALVWFILLALLGSAFMVAGVFLLAGLGPALMVAGIFMFALATLIFKGMTRG